MAKNRDINELRQTKDAHYTHPTFQGGDFIKPTNKPAKSTREVMLENNNKNPNVTTSNPFEHEEVDKTVDQIVEDLQPQIFDTIFQMINDEMTKRYVFDASEYLTEAGLELFEDEWFEFYHENHGRIMHKLLQNLK
tara:strand:+ start:339 stop:746 length:408 start_codon:yes stop_codon:yes gene_type:complete